MKLVRRMALPLAIVLAAATSLRAQEAPVPFARLSVSSVDAVNKIISDLGIPGVPDARQSIEEAPFVGAGAIDTTKPLGFVVLASNTQPLLSANSLAAAVPIAEGKATVADLTGKGLKPVEGQAATLTGEGVTVHRSGGYLTVKQGENNSTGLSVVTDDIFASDYKTPGNIAVLSLNFAALRTAAPNAYKQLLAAPALLGVPMPETNPFQAALDKLDKYTLAIAQDEKNVHIKSWTSPYPSKPAKTAPRPTFPAGTIFQMHMIYPDAEAAGALDRMVDSLPEGTFSGMPPATAKRVKDLFKRIDKINASADAVSIALTIKDSKPVFYVVSQLNADYDFAAEAKAISDEGLAIAKELSPNEKIAADISIYDASGKKATRLLVSGANPDERVVVDAIQDGKTLFLTFAADEGKYVEELSNTKMGGSSNLLCAGAIDLTALLKAASEGGGPLMGANPNTLQDLRTAFANQGITWTVQIPDTGNYMYSDVQIPTSVIKQIIKSATGALQGGHAPAGDTPPAVQP